MKSSHLIKPLLGQDYPMISHGKGVYLIDTNGKKYLDGSSGAVTANIGHGVTEIIESINEQAKKVSFVYRSQFTNEPAEQLAKKLSELAPGDVNWTFFVNSGSEATETALKIAIQYWQEQGVKGKNKIISRFMSYHGITLGALSMSGHTARRERFIELLEDFPTVSPSYCYHCPFSSTYPVCHLMCATDLEAAIQHIGADEIAAFIAEPIVGAAGGAITPPDGYYQTIKEICVRNNILFIADEVMTGMGRTGKMFAIEHWGVVPDIITIGKGMSAGYAPIAATIVSDKVMEPILKGSKIVMSGHTYSGNPLSAAASLAVIQYIEKNNLITKAREQGDYLFAQLLDLKRDIQLIGDVRGKGLMLGMEFVCNRASKLPYPKELNLTNLVVKKAFENGLLVYPANAGVEGKGGDAIIVSPPLTISKEEIDELIERLKKTLQEVEHDLQNM